MTNLILTPVYKSYEIVKEMTEAIGKNTVYPYLHILVDDDSGCGEFPIKASEKRRILMVKREYPGMVRKTGEGQAIQLGYDWAHHAVFNGQNNVLPYDHIFMIEADVIVQPEWDKKMVDVLATLPEDWLTLDVQSTNFEGKLVHPTTNWGSKVGDEREDLEVTYYPDFQCTLFNQRIFDSGVNFSFLVDPCDSCFGRAVSALLAGRHFRTKKVSVYHYICQSTRYLDVWESPYRSPHAVMEIIKDVIQDKVVCDLGCGAGDLMVWMEEYAKKVMGIESNGLVVQESDKRGLNIIEGNIFEIDLPDSDVYYLWVPLTPHDIPKLKKVIEKKKGTWIFGVDPAEKEEAVILSLGLEGEWREIEYNEGEKLRQKGIFKVFITEKL